MNRLGFPVVPNGTESRHDIIQAVTFGKAEGVIELLQGHSGGCSRGQLCDAGTLGNAGL